MAGTRLSLATIVAASITVGLTAAPLGATAAEMDGAPRKAEVRMTSTLGLPAPAYLPCGSLPACVNAGNIDLTTTAAVPVEQKTGFTQGVGPLPLSSATGAVTRSYSCGAEGGTFESQVEPASTIAGELEVAKVAGVPGTNTLGVVVNTAGDTGNEFPQEIVDRSDGGCGAPLQELTQTMGLWYYHFYLAHRDEQQDVTNDLQLDGLAYEDGVFAKTYERFVTIPSGSNTYQAFENTRIEVEPEYCAEKSHQITSATANGQSLGLDGMRFYPGQVLNAPAKAKIRLGDGSIIETENGGSFAIQDCESNKTKVFLGETIGSFWAHIKQAAAGSQRKFDVVTERAVAGVRGTILDVSYNEKKQLTRVEVEEGEVSLKGINGAKGKVMIEAGEVGVQKGKKAPKIVS